MELANEMFGLGVLSGLKERDQERKAEAEHDEDRAWQAEQRQRTRSQWKEQDAAAGTQRETSRLTLENLRAKAEREGAYDFLNDVSAGVNPMLAATRYNARGVHKIDPNSIKWDPATRNISFSSVDDIDGDGKPDVTSGSLDTMLSNTETILGRTKDRFINVPDGASVFDKEKSKFVANNAKDQQARANGMKAVKADEALVDIDPATGKARVAYTGPQYGKTGEAGDRKISPFNPEGYSKNAQDELGRLMGGKYDPSTMQFDFGGASAKIAPFAQAMQEDVANLNATAPGRLPAQYVASIYADAATQFDEGAIRAQVRQKAADDVGYVPADQRDKTGLFGGLGKPKADIVKKLEDQAVANARQQLIAKARTAISYEVSRRGEDSDPGVPSGFQPPPDRSQQNPSGGAAAPAPAPAAATPTSAPAGKAPVNGGGATPPLSAFGRGLPGTRVTFKNGQTWVLDRSGKPVREK